MIIQNNQEQTISTEQTGEVKRADPFASLFQDIKPIMELGDEEEEPEEEIVAVPKKRGRPRKNPEDSFMKDEKEPNLVTGHIRALMAEEFKKKYHVEQETLNSTLNYLAKKYKVSYCQAHAAMESEM